MLKKFFSKKEEEEADQSKKAPAARPKIVIKQRRTSSEPLPNSIANVMSPRSMPHERPTSNPPSQETEEYDVPPPIAESDAAAPERPDSDIDFYENRISELKDEIKAMELKFEENLQAKKEENQALFAKIDTVEKTSQEQITEKEDQLLQQKSNYTALEDEFLKRKETIDELNDELTQLREDYELTADELDEARQTTVAKNEFQHVQMQLRETSSKKEDLENQLVMIQKDQARYESMVTELSTHISELKGSLDSSGDEQQAKLLDVKEQEIRRHEEHIEDLLKQIKSLQSDVKAQKKSLQEKDTIIDQSQEYEEKWIRSTELVHELNEDLEELEKVRIELQDQVSLYSSDIEGIAEKTKKYETEIAAKTEAVTNLETTLNEKNQKIEELRTSLEQTTSQTDESRAETEKLADKLESLKSKAEKESELLKITQESLEKANAELEEMSAKLAENSALAGSAEDVASKQAAQIAELTSENKTLLEKTQEIETQLASYESDNTTEVLNKEIAVKTKEITSLTSQLEKLTASNEEGDSEIADLKSQLKSASEGVGAAEELRKVLDSTKAENAELAEQLESAQVELTELQKDDTVGTLEKEIKAINKEKSGLEKELDKVKTQLDAMEQDDSIEKLSSELSEAKSQTENLETEVGKLKEELAEARDTAESDSIKEQMEQIQEALKGKESELEKSISEAKELNQKIKESEEALIAKSDELSAMELQLSEAEKAGAEPELDNEASKEQEEKLVELEEKLEVLQSTIDQLEVENSELKDENTALQKAASAIVEGGSTEASVPANYNINLVMKPDNDEYELELPSNMTGKEIKVELTEAGLLEADGSYDLYLPRIDKYLMNNELLADCGISDDEVMEIIPG